MGKKVGQIVKPPEVKQLNSNSRVRRTERLQSMDTTATDCTRVLSDAGSGYRDVVVLAAVALKNSHPAAHLY